MKKFSIPQTAFSGYRLIAAKPVAALAWFVFQLAVSLAMAWLTVTMVGPQLAALQAMRASGVIDPATAMTLSSQTVPFSLLSLLLALLTGVVLMGAILRAVLRPANGGFGYLRFGKDELRLFVVDLVIVVLFIIPLVLIIIGTTIATLVMAGGPQAAAAAAMQGHGVSAAAKAVRIAAALPGAALLAFLFVKLSLAGSQTIAERGIRIFGSWRLTKGIFWRTAGSYVLASIPMAIAMAASTALAHALKPNVAGGWSAVMQPDTSSMAAAFSGPQIVIFVVQALIWTLWAAALIAPAAAIYTAVADLPPQAASDDDDDEDDDD